ncbi:MAG: glutamine-hydrolyzing GMP synthase [Candidatus Micrarchaeota archaeon]|nr:glutamine-hydrolyzing GMP synthase [Candidatus Micrarchaeota archaeon]
MFDTQKFIEQKVQEAKNFILDQKALIALSGGVDSSVCAALVHRAIGQNLHAVFVDSGLMRENEAKKVKEIFEKLGINIIVLEKQKEFLKALKGVADPEKKRKIIGKLFIKIFEDYAKKNNIQVLVQGTIAPDWIESGGAGRDTIKSHHNVGGLPKKLNLKLFEPLRDCYKHEVRALAAALALPPEIVNRQPFPGPGLAVRIIGPVDEKKLEILRKCTAILEEEIENAAKEGKIKLPWQYFAVLLDTKTVGVRGDERAYCNVLAIRAVDSLDGMTANFSKLPLDLLQSISNKITSNIAEVNRVVYDITNKPPATIEYE